MKTIKDSNIRETIVEHDGHLYLRREEDHVKWKVCAAKNGPERWWVSLCKQEELDLEKEFQAMS